MHKYDNTLIELAKERFHSGILPKQVIKEIQELLPTVPKGTILSWIYPRYYRKKITSGSLTNNLSRQTSFTSEQIMNAIVGIQRKNEQLHTENEKLVLRVDKLEKDNFALKAALRESENKSIQRVKLQIDKEISLQARE